LPGKRFTNANDMRFSTW